MFHEPISRRAALGLAGGAVGTLAAAAFGRWGGAVVQANAPSLQEGTPAVEGGIEHPTGAADAVIRIDYVGGFVPVEASFAQLPLTALYGDGLLVTQGPQIMIFPPPALPNLRQTRLTAEGVQAILAEADAAGLIGRDWRYENPMIADAPYTVITIQAGGETTRVAVYGLGTDNPQWTPEEQAAVQAIGAFVGRFIDVASWLPAEAIAAADETFAIERIQVLAQPYDQAGFDPNAAQPPVDWPIEPPLATLTEPLSGALAGHSCGILEGDAVADLVTAAEGANTLTPWVSEGEQYVLWLRPLLPDETGCPPRDPAAETLPEPEATPAD